MVDRLIHAIDHTGSNVHVQILAAPVFVSSGDNVAHRLNRSIAMNPNTCRRQCRDQISPETIGDGPVNQQALGGTANSGAPGLGVHHHVQRFLRIGGRIDINVADAFQMGEDWHAGFGLHQPDQSLAATWHNHVDILRRAQHLGNSRTVARRDALDRVLWQSGGPQTVLQARVDHA